MNDARIGLKKRLLNDREHLLYKLDRIGFVPDKDMRETFAAIRSDLVSRIDDLREELAGR